jgi:hypothetical protein
MSSEPRLEKLAKGVLRRKRRGEKDFSVQALRRGREALASDWTCNIRHGCGLRGRLVQVVHAMSKDKKRWGICDRPRPCLLEERRDGDVVKVGR